MSKADKMFEELGYAIGINNKHELEYINKNDYYINFNKQFKSIEKGCYNSSNNWYEAKPIGIQELQVINEKVKELGWKED